MSDDCEWRMMTAQINVLFTCGATNLRTATTTTHCCIPELCPQHRFLLFNMSPARNDSLQKLRDLDLITHLRNNDTLSQPSGSLSALLVAAAYDMKLYDAEISSLHVRIDQPNREKRALQKQVVIGQSLSAPIRRLPNEILAEIFQFACYAGFYTEIPCVFHFASVCTVWRSVALSTPWLWARLFVTLSMNWQDLRPEFFQQILPLTNLLHWFAVVSWERMIRSHRL